jgi:cytochrome c-type biogenesis protein
MLSYSLGLGIPFLIAGAFLAQFNSFMKFVSPYIKTINLVFGIVLIILGILVFTGTLSSVANLDFLNIYLLR